MQIQLETVKETIGTNSASGLPVVFFDGEAEWTFKYKNGYVVSQRGPLNIRMGMSAVNEPGSSQPTYTYKIECFTFDSKTHDKMLKIDAINGTRMDPVKVADYYAHPEKWLTNASPLPPQPAQPPQQPQPSQSSLPGQPLNPQNPQPLASGSGSGASSSAQPPASAPAPGPSTGPGTGTAGGNEAPKTEPTASTSLVQPPLQAQASTSASASGSGSGSSSGPVSGSGSGSGISLAGAAPSSSSVVGISPGSIASAALGSTTAATAAGSSTTSASAAMGTASSSGASTAPRRPVISEANAASGLYLIPIPYASIPCEPVNAFGIPQATMRCLEVCFFFFFFSIIWF